MRKKPEAQKAARGMWWVAKLQRAEANIKARDYSQESTIQGDEEKEQGGGGDWGGAEAFPWGRHVKLAFMCLQERS